MKYLIKNLKHFFRDDKAMAFLCIFCSFLTAVVIFFSVGLIQHFQKQREYGDSDSYDMTIAYTSLRNLMQTQNADYKETALSYKHYLTVGELKALLREVDPSVLNNCSIINISAMYSTNTDSIHCEYLDGGGLSINNIDLANLYFCYDKQADMFTATVSDQKNAMKLSAAQPLLFGKRLTNEDYIDGRKNIVMGIGVFNDLFVSDRKKAEYGYNTEISNTFDYALPKSFTAFGEDYQIIGITQRADELTLPISSLPDTMILKSIGPYLLSLHYDVPITHLQYTYLNAMLEDRFDGELSVREIDFHHRYAVFYSMMLSAVCMIAIIAAINIALMFRYVILKRKRQIAVFKLCGCSGFKMILIFFGEVMVLIVPSFLIGMFVYFSAVSRKMQEIFIYMRDVYTNKVCIVSCLIAIAILGFILFLAIWDVIRRNPLKNWKGE